MLAIINFGPTNRALTETTTEIISNKIGSKVQIGKLEIGLFNRLILKDITINDRTNQTLLKAKLMTAKIELRSLFRKQLSLRTISVLDANINLYKTEKDSPANFQFIIDAFSSKKSSSDSNINLRINSLILRRINIAYNEHYRKETAGKINPHHLSASNLNANISLKEITPDSLRLNIRSLSFQEKSGFTLQNMRLRMQANRSHAIIEDFEVALPHSVFQLNGIKANYNAREQWSQIFNTLQVYGKISKAQIATNDLKPVVSIPTNLDVQVKISSDFNITPQQIALNDLQITEQDKHLQLVANAALLRKNGKAKGIIVNIKTLNIQQPFTTKIANCFGRNTQITSILNGVGDIAINGYGMYHFDGDVSGEINLHTQHGLVHLEGEKKKSLLKASFKITNANPANVVAKPQLPQLITASGSLKGNIKNKKIEQGAWSVNIDKILWNNYTYSQIKSEGTYRPEFIDLGIQSHDINALTQAQIKIALQGKKLKAIDSNIDVQAINPATLNLNTPYNNASFKGHVSTQLSFTENIPTGNIAIQNFCMTNAPKGNIKVDKLVAELSECERNNGHLKLRGDFIKADIHGPKDIKRLTNGITAILNRSLPGLIKKQHDKVLDSDEWKIKIDLTDSEVLSKMLNLNLHLTNGLNVQGIINANKGRSSITAYTDGININNNILGRSSIYINGQDNQYNCLIQTNKDVKGKDMKLVANLQSKDSLLHTQIAWKSEDADKFSGTFYSSTRFVNSPQTVNFTMNIHPTKFMLEGAEWGIASGNISLINKEFAFKDLKIARENQMLAVNGKLSPHNNDSITANLENIDIQNVLDLVNFDAVAFGGRATGKAILTKSTGSPELHAQLHVPDFTFNNGPMGVADIEGFWNKKENKIQIDANMQLVPETDLGTKVKGYVSLAEKGLELNIQANRTNLKFLRRYMDGIFSDFNGDATGTVKLYGPFKKLDFEGELKANASARIVATGVKYDVTDGIVKLSSGEFAFKDFNIDDRNKGSGKANGYLRHTHLKNLTYAFNVSAQNLLCYDMPKNSEMPFYSTTTGSGSISLQGKPGYFSADIALRPTAPTKFVYTLGTPEATSTSDNMIRFRNGEANNSSHSAESGNDEEPDKQEVESSTDIVLNFMVDATPAAEVKIITDPRSGDAITAYGEGPIKATFHNKGNFEMYGTYRLTRGTYKLSIQDVIKKDLNLQAGSTITFNGPPLLADLGLKAVYTVNGVSLSDLNYGAGFSQKSVKVDCILNIGGKAKAPQVNFDLDLHNISDDEKQMVRQLIATDEDMNRQVIYLLGIGRFYTANTQTSEGQSTSQQQSTAAMRSFLSTTLTSQLNTAISSALGSQSHWSFGTNVATGTYGWNDIEVDGLLQGRLFNDRLLINGNFGYRDKPTYTSNFVGDFDIKYLLTPKGSISLKAYSETTDRYFTKSSLTTQGVGISLQREFNNLRDLFNFTKPRKKNKTKKKRVSNK